MSGYVDQHYVPQAYLNHFADLCKNKKTYRIGVLRVDKGKVNLFTNSVENVAYKPNIYDDNLKPDPKHWEHLFSNKYEKMYGNPIDRIVSKSMLLRPGIKVISAAEKTQIGKMIAIQFLRMPNFIEKKQKKGKKIGIDIVNEAKRVFGVKLSSKDRKEIERLCTNTNCIRSTLLELITDENRLEFYAKIIADNVMNVVINNTSIPFCTSDNPVILYNMSLNSCDYGVGGIARPDTFILYPLSPKVMIQVGHKALYNGNDIDFDGKRIYVGEDKIDYVIRANLLQMQHAQYESYYPPTFIEKIKAV